jgi:hypothetical protein
MTDNTLKRLNILEETLRKASDRIRGGKRTDRPSKLSTKDAMYAISSLLNDANISPEAKKALAGVHKTLSDRAQRENVSQMSSSTKPIELGAAGKAKEQEKAAEQGKVQEWLETNQPKQIKELGHGGQYEADQQPAARPKSTSQITGPVKERMGTGEGIAVPDKNYGAALDVQRKLKEKEASVRAGKGPEAVIRVPGRLHDDDIVNELMKLKTTLPKEHHDHIDKEIGNRLSEIGTKEGA